MDARLQAKLLRAMQEREIDRVGGAKPVKVDIRILATSNRDLAQAVKDGTFREDLLYRLNVVNLRLPPLRERPGDVVGAGRVTSSRSTPPPTACRSGRSRPRPSAAPGRPPLARQRARAGERHAPRGAAGDRPRDRARTPSACPTASRWRARPTPAPRAAPGRAAQAAEAATRAFVGQTVAEMEQQLILDTLAHCLGNRTHAANILGISIRTLRNKLKEYADAGVADPRAPAGVAAPPTTQPERELRNVTAEASSTGLGAMGVLPRCARRVSRRRLTSRVLDLSELEQRERRAAGLRRARQGDRPQPGVARDGALHLLLDLQAVSGRRDPGARRTRGEERLDRAVPVTPADMISHAPVTEPGGRRRA